MSYAYQIQKKMFLFCLGINDNIFCVPEKLRKQIPL